MFESLIPRGKMGRPEEICDGRAVSCFRRSELREWGGGERIDALAELANEGTLSDSERSEYEALITASDFISILKLKARLNLDSHIQ